MTPESPSDLVTRLWVIPLVPPSLNEWQSMHWGPRAQLKNRWYELIWALQHQRDTKLPECDWVSMSADIVFKTKAHRDVTNYAATFWKIVPDALQHVGVIRDDTEEQLHMGAIRFKYEKPPMPNMKGTTRIAITGAPTLRLMALDG